MKNYAFGLESGLTQYICNLNDKSGGYFYLRSTPVLRNVVSRVCEQQRVPQEITSGTLGWP